MKIVENILGSMLGQLISKGATYQGGSNFKIEDNRCNVALNPGENCEIVVRFMPRLGGRLRGTLQVSVGDGAATASLSGERRAQPSPSQEEAGAASTGRSRISTRESAGGEKANHTLTRRRPGADAARQVTVVFPAEPSGGVCLASKSIPLFTYQYGQNSFMPKHEIKVAHSPDSDDAFMFYGLATNKLETDELKFEHILKDIQIAQRRRENTAFST